MFRGQGERFVHLQTFQQSRAQNRDLIAGGSLGWMVRGSMVVRSLSSDGRSKYLILYVGAIPGRGICPRAIYRG